MIWIGIGIPLELDRLAEGREEGRRKEVQAVKLNAPRSPRFSLFLSFFLSLSLPLSKKKNLKRELNPKRSIKNMPSPVPNNLPTCHSYKKKGPATHNPMFNSQSPHIYHVSNQLTFLSTHLMKALFCTYFSNLPLHSTLLCFFLIKRGRKGRIGFGGR